MTGTQYSSSTPPPKKYRDPAFVSISKDELNRQQEEYVKQTMKTSALESLRQGTMQPSPVRIAKEGRIQLEELQKSLNLDLKILLNMAFSYGHNEAQKGGITVQALRAKFESLLTSEESLPFDIDESTLDILLNSGLEDAKFLYLNFGISLLYARLIKLDVASIV